jgi:hypothetical protein
MPPIIPCANTRCDGMADKLGGLCRKCQKEADERARLREANEWRWKGWRKNKFDHRKGYKQK